MNSSGGFIQDLFADRIGGKGFGLDSTIYKFEKIKRAKRAAAAAQPDTELLDFGVGEPDEMAPEEVVKSLSLEAEKPENRGYADNGGPELKQAAARYLKKVCGVTINPDTQIIHSIGSKAALSLLPATLINPGDVTIMTIPGYPVFGTHAKYYGGEIYNLPLEAKKNFLPDLNSIPRAVLEKAKVLVLNYPNNPTGASATPEFFSEVVEFAKKFQIVVIHDCAYSGLVFEGKPLSFLATPGAIDIGIELHSTSKNFNMTGWRCGFVAGNELLVKAYGAIKDNSDSGQFLAIQNAAAYAFDHPEFTQLTAKKYSRRMDLMVPPLQAAGFPDAHKPKGSFFIYVKAPTAVTDNVSHKKTEFENAEECSQWLITELLISTVPWDDVGSYLRFSVTFNAKGEAEERRVVEELNSRLGRFKFEWV